MGMSVQQVDTRSAPEEILAAMHECYILLEAEELPDDSPTPIERRILDWRHWREGEDIPRWLLWDGDEVVAVAVVWLDLEQNLENGFARIYVSEDRRGEGHSKALAGPVFDYLQDHERKRVNTYVVDGVPAEGLCRRMGLKSVYSEKRSRLVIGEVDRELMQGWVDRAPQRASDYHLVELETPFPEENVDPYCQLLFQMNTAPMEDFEMDDEVMTPDMWRSMEKMLEQSEKDLITTIAVHTETGEYVGSTSIQYDRLHRAQGWQWETVVHPDHRNNGLGRWLKGANILRTMGRHPEIEHIDTWNAGSNEPMLNINVAMGFGPILITNEWQGEAAEARRKLGV